MITETIQSLAETYKIYVHHTRQIEDQGDAKDKAADALYGIRQDVSKLTPEEFVSIFGCDLEEAREISLTEEDDILGAADDALRLVEGRL